MGCVGDGLNRRGWGALFGGGDKGCLRMGGVMRHSGGVTRQSVWIYLATALCLLLMAVFGFLARARARLRLNPEPVAEPVAETVAETVTARRTQDNVGIEPEWVIIALYSGDEESARRAEATWFRRDKGIGRVATGFYRGADVECRSPWAGGGEFQNMRRAFLQASRCFPHARLFARLNIDSKVDTDQLVGQVLNMSAVDYLGRPVKSSGLVFASGADGYVLSLKSVRRLESCAPSSLFDSFEDAAVGYCLQEAGINLTHLP